MTDFNVGDRVRLTDTKSDFYGELATVVNPTHIPSKIPIADMICIDLDSTPEQDYRWAMKDRVELYTEEVQDENHSDDEEPLAPQL